MFNCFIDYLRLFKNIPDADARLIENKLNCREVRENDVLLTPGEVCGEMFFICKGVLRIVSQNQKGNPLTYFFVKENQLCCILNSFNHNLPSGSGIEAACNASLVVIKKRRLLMLYDELPYLRELITGITTQALLDKIELKNSYEGEDAATRYRNFLLRQPDIALRVSLGDIASYLGITPQSLSRIRKKMRW